MPTARHCHARTTPESRPITVQINHERTLTPQQQAAWEWFVQEVHRRLAREQQEPTQPPTPEEPPA